MRVLPTEHEASMPYLSSTIFIVVLVLALLLALTGYFLLARSLFPGWVERAEASWTARPVATFALGVPVAAILALVSIGLVNAPNPILRILGMLMSASSLGFTFGGTAGLAGRIGQGMRSPSDEGREWSRLLRAGIVLELSMLFPILGWFLILPIAVVGGAGAATIALFSRRSPKATIVPIGAIPAGAPDPRLAGHPSPQAMAFHSPADAPHAMPPQHAIGGGAPQK